MSCSGGGASGGGASGLAAAAENAAGAIAGSIRNTVRTPWLLWDAVLDRKTQETEAWCRIAFSQTQGPYAALLSLAEASLQSDELLMNAEQEIAKDVKRTFPSMDSYAARGYECATRNILLAYSYRNPAVGYCQALNFICGVLLLARLSEEDAFFSLCTLVEDVLPLDYYARETGLLGARIDQLVLAELLAQDLPHLHARLQEMQCPISLFSIQWFMCLFAKDLPLPLTLRVWNVLFVYGDHALFAFALAILHFAQRALLSANSLQDICEVLQNLGTGELQRNADAAHKFVLHAFDSLMRSTLMQFVEAERSRQRRWLAAETEAAACESLERDHGLAQTPLEQPSLPSPSRRPAASGDREGAEREERAARHKASGRGSGTATWSDSEPGGTSSASSTSAWDARGPSCVDRAMERE